MPTESKDDYQAQLFSNRLAKRYKHLRKWARKNGVTCYRVYDRDIPEIPLSLDLYEFLPDEIGDKKSAARFTANEFACLSENDSSVQAEIASRSALVICLYERPYEKPAAEERAWLSEMAEAARGVFGIAKNRVIIKTRKRDKGGSQYACDADETPHAPDGNGSEEKAERIEGIIQECGELFRVLLNGRIDSGLFFDHRLLRIRVRESVTGKSVLNLFCYTGSFSVYAAEGGARTVDSVDLSNTYLDRAKENMRLNGFSDEKKYRFIRDDAAQFIVQKKASRERYDIIVLDPPTFSNSKMTHTVLDLAKDWPRFVNGCIALLAQGGVLYFSTNAKRLRFDESLIDKGADGNDAGKNDITVHDITGATIPEDFLQKKPHRTWEIRRK